MENINAVVVVAGIAMIVAIIVFIRLYNAKSKSESELEHYNPSHWSPVIMAPYQRKLTEYDPVCEEEALSGPMMIKIVSINRIKEKSRQFLMDSETNYTKKQADAILNDLSQAFSAEGLNLHHAPFEYIIQ